MESYSVLFPPIKRHINQTSTTMHDPNTRNSFPETVSNRFKPPQPPLFIPPGHVVFRLLCHASRVGGVIGKSGSIIKQLQQLTNSRIRVEDPPDGVDHRVISVVSSPEITNRVRLPGLAPKYGEETDGNTDIIDGGGDGGEWFTMSAAQEGTLRVFERVVEVAAEVDTAAAYGGVVSCRLLVTQYHGGAVIGKGGNVVEKIKKDTGCRINVFSSEKFFSGSFDLDEIVEIEGNILAVMKGLIAVTSRLQEFLPLEKMKTHTTRSLETESLPIPNGNRPIVQVMPSSYIKHASPRGYTSWESEKILNMDARTPLLQEVVFKILCPNEKVGGIIGKGGFIIKDINNKTGASISIEPMVADCDERVISITAMESADSQYSSAQNAAILVFNRCMELDLDSKGSFVLARLLVPSNQVGCLLGKGGAIISDMRKATGTGLWFIGGNQVPGCASENVEVLQITGELANVQNALFAVTGRLRDYMFSKLVPNRRGNFISSRTEDNLSGSVKDLSLGISVNLNEDKSLTQSMYHLRISNNTGRPTSPNLLASQIVSRLNRGNIMDNGGRLPSFKGGVEIGSGNRSAIVTNTTIEIVVPDTVIGSICGDNGSNLARLRQISGAKVMVHEPPPGTNLRIIVVSGTPDETQAAQSLLQAFILAG